MDFLSIVFSLALPLALGASVLFALDWPRTNVPAGRAAMRFGYGYVVGALLLTLWMRALSVVGLRFSWASVSLPLLVVTVALMVWAGKRGRDRFVVLETGFGLGNNFLATWAAWRADPRRCRQLHFVSIEQCSHCMCHSLVVESLDDARCPRCKSRPRRRRQIA